MEEKEIVLIIGIGRCREPLFFSPPAEIKKVQSQNLWDE